MSGIRVAVLGAAGAVGQEILKVLAERDFPVAEMRLLATSRSAGLRFEFKGTAIPVEEVGPDSFKGIDVAFFAATTEASREFAPLAVQSGGIVVDKSNAFRMDPEVPLVVPEVNARRLSEHKGIIASPNCSTIQLVVALKPLYDLSRIRRIVVSSYQSVSGTGRDAMDELEEETRRLMGGLGYERRVYPHQIAFNLIPHIDSFDARGYTGEEMKLVNETRKILEDPEIAITATCVRVPVFIGHAEAVLIETEERLAPEKAREALVGAPGVVVVDDPPKADYPMPVFAAGRDEVFVGRIREDISSDRGLLLWVVADNLRKGAATNAIQIAEYLVNNSLL